jgi:hypothetical protein
MIINSKPSKYKPDSDFLPHLHSEGLNIATSLDQSLYGNTQTSFICNRYGFVSTAAMKLPVVNHLFEDRLNLWLGYKKITATHQQPTTIYGFAHFKIFKRQRLFIYDLKASLFFK